MYCPSCERLMPGDTKYCGHCGMPLNAQSERLTHISTDFAWIWRRSWAGFAAGFIGWIIAFFISRMLKQDIGPAMVNLFTGTICGVFLGTVGGIIENSAYKAVLGGVLGAAGGALGGVLNIPLMEFLRGYGAPLPVSILMTWSCGGACIGAVSGIIERSRKKALIGALFGLLGGALGGLLGSSFYGSLMLEFAPHSWGASRLAEGLSGGLVGAVLWFCIGLIEKLYIFRRTETAGIDEKICEFCGRHNPLTAWFCAACGHVLQTAAPRQKIETTPFRGMERLINSLQFLSWLFGTTGVITTPVIFMVFLFQDLFLAVVSAIFSVLFTYCMVVAFRFLADLLSCCMRLSSAAAALRPDKKP